MSFDLGYEPPQALQDAWDEIPDPGCKGLCTESCGPISGSPVEIRLLATRGVRLPDVEGVMLDVAAGAEVPDCPALVDGRCSVYEVRPTVCRLWGAVDTMPCEFGCRPHGGRLSDDEGRRVMFRAMAAGSP